MLKNSNYLTYEPPSYSFIVPAGNKSTMRWAWKVIVVLMVLSWLIVFIPQNKNGLNFVYDTETPPVPKISKQSFEQSWIKCQRLTDGRSSPSTGVTRKRNARFNVPSVEGKDNSTAAKWIRNATLINGDGIDNGFVDVVFHQGLVWKVSSVPLTLKDIQNEIGDNEEIVEINANGHFLTPGIVDAHSHTGTDSWPSLEATDDTNEMAESPTVPYLRSIDGFNPHDPAISVINAGGVTTSLILPGSGNLMGGEAFVFKHRRVKSNLVSDMRVDFNHNVTEDGFQWRYMKMACGENIKRSYGERGIMPDSRLGEGGLFREQFQGAKEMKNAQDGWCSIADQVIREYGREKAYRYMDRIFPYDQKWESLVALLRGDVRLQNHCYETYDLEMMLRHSKEFGFKVTAFHHALEAWQLADTLAKENISVALFADHWGYKKEAYGTSVYAAQKLTAAGVQVSFKSDHPVLNSQHLIFEAQKAHHYGLDRAHSIQAVTSIPANILGLDHRLGYLRNGYDADAVLWDRHPLLLGATPIQVFVDGFETYHHPSLHLTLTPQLIKFSNRTHPQDRPIGCENYGKDESSFLLHHELTNMNMKKKTILLKNIHSIYADEDNVLAGGDLVILSEDGIVKCYGEVSICHPLFTQDMEVMDGFNGTVIPGLVAGHVHLGLEEIPAEENTKDGYVPESRLEDGPGVRAVDGLRLGLEGSKILTAAYHGGILTAVSVPRAAGTVQGQTVGFHVGADNVKDGVLKSVAGVSISVGNRAKEYSSSISRTISSQFKSIRSALLKAIENYNLNINSGSKSSNGSVLNEILEGIKPLMIEVNEVNDMLKLIQLKSEIENALAEKKTDEASSPSKRRRIQMTFVGGAEAWWIAEDLAEAKVNVLLKPARCTPGSWETRQCLLPGSIGVGIDFERQKYDREGLFPAAHILKKKGVKVGLGFDEDNFARGLLWEAGWVYATSDAVFKAKSKPGNEMKFNTMSEEYRLTPQEALGMVTWDVAEITGLNKLAGTIQLNKPAKYLLFNADPIQGMHQMGGLASHLQMIVDGKNIICHPKQF